MFCPAGPLIEELIESGVAVDAEITVEIIEAIFQKSSPMHDGAILVEGAPISPAGPPYKSTTPS